MDSELRAMLATNQAIYGVFWSLFDGSIWADKDKHGARKWPLGINLIQTACFTHSACWAGDLPDTGEPIVKPLLRPKLNASGKVSKKAENAAARAADTIDQLWYENGGRSGMLSANVVAQAVGGVVYKLRYEPGLDWAHTLPVRIEPVLPDYFVCRPDPSNWFNLLEAWIVRRIPIRQAELSYGYVRKHGDSKDQVQMAEYWTQTTYQVTVEGRPARFGKDGDFISGKNPYGFIPAIYIPHVRANEFPGIPLSAQVVDLSQELNARMADLGDTMMKGVHNPPFIRNVPANHGIKILKVGDQTFFDIGGGLGEQKREPDVFRLDAPNVGEAGKEYVAHLERLTKEMMNTPEVAYGTDSGSQRSGESRDRLLFPLTIHINMEREFWTGGVSAADEMMLRILAHHNWKGIGEEHLGHRMSQIWAPMYPQDRQRLVEEMTVRAAAYLAAPEHALKAFGDEDVEEHVAQIKAWMEFRKGLSEPTEVEPDTPDRTVAQAQEK